MRLVVIESPYGAKDAETIERNLRYLRACMNDCIAKGDSPFASHGLYTQPGVLRDEVPEERELGILAGFAWRKVAEATVVYLDLGTSGGMQDGIKHAQLNNRPIEYRRLGDDWNADHQIKRSTSSWTGDGRLGDAAEKIAGLFARNVASEPLCEAVLQALETGWDAPAIVLEAANRYRFMMAPVEGDDDGA